jgi:hypothetical protein
MQAPLDKTNDVKQVMATFVAVQVEAPAGQIMHAPEIKEYPELHEIGTK